MKKEVSVRTKLLFKENVYQRSCRAELLAVEKRNGKLCLITDRTVFFPVGGGQSCDVGEIEGFLVSAVYEEDGVVFHQIDAENCALSAGDTVQMEIDWKRRFDNMQRHCGEHILSGAFYTLCGGQNRGFHMGNDYMTVDIALPDDSGGKITWDMAKEAERLANEAIWQDLPVTTRRFDRRADAEQLPLRKALAFDEDISIVTVGREDTPVDCVACCGTHPDSAGQVGLIKIYKVEKNKDMFRIYFDAGERAFHQYQRQFDLLSALEEELSAGTDDLLKKYRAQQEKHRAVKDRLYRLKKEIVSREAAELKDVRAAVICKAYRALDQDDMINIGNALLGSIPGMLLLLHEPSRTVFLFSDAHDCGRLVREEAKKCEGKGGGKACSARAVFPSDAATKRFIELIEGRL